MQRIVLLLLVSFVLFSCGSAKPKITTKKTKNTQAAVSKKAAVSPLVKKIITNAKAYEGVRYKYGGTTKKGMDCSGLIHTAFKEEQIELPRISREMATHGNWIDLKKVQEGDLLFFATKKGSRKVNHVGLVTSARVGQVEFIHSSTSKGVIISNLAEKYWYFAFVQARRVL